MMILSSTYQPWHDKQTGRSYLKPADGQCLPSYFYFIDEELGLGQVRVPTWLPCRLQVYCNGQHWLAAQLRRRRIGYRLLDNAFLHIEDWAQAQRDRRRLAGGAPAPPTGPVRRPFLPGVPSLRRALSLERGPVRVRPRHRVPPAGGSAAPSMGI